MILTINDRQGQEHFAQGGIYMECLMITSDVDLVVNQKIWFSPALFDNTIISTPEIQDTEYHWELAYPGIAGTFPMFPINFDNKYKNMLVKIRFFTPRIFSVTLEYLATSDTGKYLYPYPLQPLQYWQNQHVEKSAGANVYNSIGRRIGLRVTVRNIGNTAADDFVESQKTIQGKQWEIVNYPSIDNRYYLESNGQPVNGFITGQDLKVKLRNFPELTNSQYFAGIYRTDKLLDQGLEFYNELRMQMAKANNTADEPFMFATGTISKIDLKDFHGFRYDHFESIADYTIDDAYFDDPTARYRLFVITKESCQWRSYLFDEFGIHNNREAPTGTIDITTVKVDTTTVVITQGSCLYEVPHGSEMEYQAEFDIPSYEADLLAKGYPGGFADYFVGFKAYISDGINQLGVEVTDQIVVDSYVGNKAIINYKFKVPDSWQGLAKYPNFVWIFDYKDGNVDHITAFTQIHIHVGTPTDIEYGGVPLPAEICYEDASEQEFCFENPTAAHEFFVDLLREGEKINNTPLITAIEADFSTAANACLTFDYPNAETDTQYCFKMRAHTPTITGTARPCTDIKIIRNPSGIFGLYHTFGHELVGWVDADILYVKIIVMDINYKVLGTYLSIGKAAYEQIFLPGNGDTPWRLSIHVVRNDGHTYHITGIFNWTKGIDSSALFNICTEVKFQDCPENPILSHTTVWNYFAPPPPYGSIQNKTVTAIFTNPGVPTSQLRQYSLNGAPYVAYTVPLILNRFDRVTFKWTLTYSPTCTIVLYDCVTDEECSAP